MYTVGIISLLIMLIAFLVIYTIAIIRRNMKKAELLKDITNKANLVELKFLSTIDALDVAKEDIDTLKVFLVAMYVLDHTGKRYQKISKEIEKRGYGINLKLLSSGTIVPEVIK